ncbi:MAG TPA: BlaI/MecI/CopY family transcriptional regulator [Humisphaera sp.]|jgi:predicted transcriptional regulator|nr:BlaI/MecI/CopY family transcriptional regulator [Humisphaera sp.]
MARPKQDLTEAEMAIMDLLWREGRASIRQVVDGLGGATSAGRYATIQKQLERLEAKQMVRRDRSLFVHVFLPAVSREDLIGRRLLSMIERLCGGSLVPLLSSLTRGRKLTAEERKALRRLIDPPAKDETKGA